MNPCKCPVPGWSQLYAVCCLPRAAMCSSPACLPLPSYTLTNKDPGTSLVWRQPAQSLQDERDCTKAPLWLPVSIPPPQGLLLIALRVSLIFLLDHPASYYYSNVEMKGIPSLLLGFFFPTCFWLLSSPSAMRMMISLLMPWLRCWLLSKHVRFSV